MSGNLPDDIWSICGLRVVDFSDNYLDGEIPYVKIESLSSNNFSSELLEKIVNVVVEGCGF